MASRTRSRTGRRCRRRTRSTTSRARSTASRTSSRPSAASPTASLAGITDSDDARRQRAPRAFIGDARLSDGRAGHAAASQGEVIAGARGDARRRLLDRGLDARRRRRAVHRRLREAGGRRASVRARRSGSASAISGDIAFNSLVNTAETYMRDVGLSRPRRSSASTRTTPRSSSRAPARSSFGNHLGLAGAFARNGFFAQTRVVHAGLDDQHAETSYVLATSTPVALAFADGGSGTRSRSSLAGSVTKTDVINIAEARRGHDRDGGPTSAATWATSSSAAGLLSASPTPAPRRATATVGFLTHRRRAQPRRAPQRGARVHRDGRAVDALRNIVVHADADETC